MEVPLMLLVAPSPVCQEETIAVPGAQTSRQRPQLLVDAFASLLVMFPTVMPSGTSCGLYRQASSLLFPAACTQVMPEATSVLTAWSIDGIEHAERHPML